MILAVLVMFLAAAPVAAADAFRVNIPFDFQVGDDRYAAGEYRFKRVSPLLISFERIDHGGERHVLGVLGSNLFGGYNEFELTFHQYGDINFLREVTSPGSTFYLARTKSEKEADRDGRFGKAKRVVKIK